MPKFRIQQWFRDISIRKKLNFTIGIMAVLVLVELFTLWFSVHLLSGVRAAVQQEGTWSKAQKDAVNTLQQYAFTADTSNFDHFNSLLEVNKSVSISFTELEKAKPDYAIILNANEKSGVDPNDSYAVTDLFYYFRSFSYVENCIEIYWNANEYMMELEILGRNLHAQITKNGALNSAETALLFEKLRRLNAELTQLEVNFSNTLGEAARWLDSLMLRLLFAIALTVEVTGVLMAISVSRGISKGINEVIRVSKQVAKGNFKEKAKVFSKDEIGVLATSFNEMIDEVSNINLELKQFAYIASDDLQEPLLNISNFNNLLQDPESNLSANERIKIRGFIDVATKRMQDLIKDLMDFSRIDRVAKMKELDLNLLLQKVTFQLQSKIDESKAIVKVDDLPKVKGSEIELFQLFQNLISNAIKFQKKGHIPEINIQYSSNKLWHKFVVKDNGIGIPAEYHQRIFSVFQRLHTTTEFEGTGIGLAICMKVIQLHKGHLEVKSEEGKGSEFHFSIPKNLEG